VGQWAVYLIWMAAWAAVIILGLLESRAPRPAATASAATWNTFLGIVGSSGG